MSKTLRLDAGSKVAAFKKAADSLSDEHSALRLEESYERPAASPEEEPTTVWVIEVE